LVDNNVIFLCSAHLVDGLLLSLMRVPLYYTPKLLHYAKMVPLYYTPKIAALCQDGTIVLHTKIAALCQVFHTPFST
jgi:hypothetical protein